MAFVGDFRDGAKTWNSIVEKQEKAEWSKWFYEGTSMVVGVD